MEEENLALLQNIEAAIISFYRSRPELSDFQVDGALEALSRTYLRTKIGGSPVKPKPGLASEVYEAVKSICDWRLGHGTIVDEEGRPIQIGSEAPSIDEILTALKRIRKSISLWNKQGGTRGYLDYVSKFMPR